MKRKQKLRGQIHKTLISGFILFFVLVGMVFTLGLLRTYKDQRTKAAASTKISLAPTSSQSTPLQKNPNDVIALDIMMDPGQNSVTLATIVLQYDTGKLQYVADSFVPNLDAFDAVLEGPVLEPPGTFAFQIGTGFDTTKAISAPVKVGTVSFTAIDGTGGTPTAVTFTSQTSALSIGANDSAVENVVSTTEPAYVAISGTSTNPTATPLPPTQPPQATEPPLPTDPQPTQGGNPTEPPLPTDPQPTQDGNPTTAPSDVPGSPKPTKPGVGGPKPSSKPSEFKERIVRILERRLQNLEERLRRLRRRDNVSPRAVRQLERTIDRQIARVRAVLHNVRQSNKDQDVKREVKRTLKDILGEYKDLARKLDRFSKGMESVARGKGKGNSSRAAQYLAVMNEHVKNAEMIANKTDAGIDTVTTDEGLKLAIDAVEQNSRIIKGELTKAEQAMSEAAVEIQK